MRAAFDAVVFDLDGTLVDTALDLQTHVNTVLGELGRRGLALDDVRLMVGDGARTLLQRGLEATGGVPAGVDLGQLYRRFLERYTADPVQKSTVHAGVVLELERLKARAVKLGVCTIRRRRRPIACSGPSDSIGSSKRSSVAMPCRRRSPKRGTCASCSTGSGRGRRAR